MAQGSSAGPAVDPPIAAYEKRLNVTRAFALSPPPGTEHVIVDTPAALSSLQLPETVRDASAIVVPGAAVGHRHPRGLALHRGPAAGRQGAPLGEATGDRREPRAPLYEGLPVADAFLRSLRIPVAAVLRDSQAYVRSAETGMGLHEMKGALLQEDLDSWKPLIDWLERRSFSLVPLNDPAQPPAAPQPMPEEPQPAATTGEYSYWPAGR